MIFSPSKKFTDFTSSRWAELLLLFVFFFTTFFDETKEKLIRWRKKKKMRNLSSFCVKLLLNFLIANFSWSLFFHILYFFWFLKKRKLCRARVGLRRFRFYSIGYGTLLPPIQLSKTKYLRIFRWISDQLSFKMSNPLEEFWAHLWSEWNIFWSG